jgi:acylphosphatase
MHGTERTNAMTVCRRVHYSGSLQGVGFRYRTKRLAEGYAVHGFVKHLPDGRVEMLVEGEITEVERFLEAVQAEMDGYIEATQVQEVELRGVTGFRIAS